MRLLQTIKRNKNDRKNLEREEDVRNLAEIREPKWHMSVTDIDEYCSRQELEDTLNELLLRDQAYGDIILRIKRRKVSITRLETYNKRNRYFAKVIYDDEMTSIERTIRELRAVREISSKDCLVDVTYYKNFRILVFKKEEL